MVEDCDVYISDEISTAGLEMESGAGWAGAYTGPRVTRDHAALAGSCDWDAVQCRLSAALQTHGSATRGHVDTARGTWRPSQLPTPDNTAAAHSGEVLTPLQHAVVTPETVEEGGSVLWLSSTWNLQYTRCLVLHPADRSRINVMSKKNYCCHNRVWNKHRWLSTSVNPTRVYSVQLLSTAHRSRCIIWIIQCSYEHCLPASLSLVQEIVIWVV